MKKTELFIQLRNVFIQLGSKPVVFFNYATKLVFMCIHSFHFILQENLKAHSAKASLLRDCPDFAIIVYLSVMGCLSLVTGDLSRICPDSHLT